MDLAHSVEEALLRQRDRATLLIMPYDSSGTLVYTNRLESRTYRMALLIASRGPSALAEPLVGDTV